MIFMPRKKNITIKKTRTIIPKSIRIFEDQSILLDDKVGKFNLSQWVRNKLDEKFPEELETIRKKYGLDDSGNNGQ